MTGTLRTRLRRTTARAAAAATAGLLGALGTLGALGALAGPAAAADGKAPSGGLSFNAASPLSAGEQRIDQTLVAGEHLYWKLPLKAGQGATIRASVTVPDSFPYGITDIFGVRMYGALREQLTCDTAAGDSEILLQESGTGKVEVVCDLDSERTGTYYLEIAIGEISEKAGGTGVPLTATVEPGSGGSNNPDDAFESGPAAPAAADDGSANDAGGDRDATNTGENAGTDSEAADLAWPIGAGALGLAVGFTAAWAAIRPRTGGTTAPPPPPPTSGFGAPPSGYGPPSSGP